jgi:hypothetical protein
VLRRPFPGRLCFMLVVEAQQTLTVLHNLVEQVVVAQGD